MITMTTGKMNKEFKAAVAMSGGVDSSVTALLLKQAGCDVIGLTMQIWPRPDEDRGCCSLSAVEDARRVAAHLDIPHYVLNFREPFEHAVVDYFCSEYLNGRTPNPCIECNRVIKFQLLLERVLSYGYDFLATGHYARVSLNEDGRYRLLTGIDPAKDQTYFLYPVGQRELAHLLFPLGTLTKPQVREIARRHSLPVAEKPESQEICFVTDGRYADFLEQRCGEQLKPGFIRMRDDGRILGRHQGIHRFTLGQRKSLGIPAQGTPVYVTAIDAAAHTIWVGKQSDLYSTRFTADNAVYMTGRPPAAPFDAQVKIRSAAPAVPALITPLTSDRFDVLMSEPQRAITPGQSAVLYDGENVIGGGLIQSVL